MAILSLNVIAIQEFSDIRRIVYGLLSRFAQTIWWPNDQIMDIAFIAVLYW